MDFVLRCSQCGGIIQFEEQYDTYYGEDKIIVSCVGSCNECRQGFLYDEVYNFSHYEGIQKEE